MSDVVGGRREADRARVEGAISYRVGFTALISVLMIVGGALYAQVTAQVAAQETRLAAVERQAERIVRVETRLDGIERQLAQMDTKLDRALERRP